MAKNPIITSLDVGQAFKRTFDEANDALRVEIGSSSGFNISLSSDSGDSIVSVPIDFDLKASVTSTSTGVVIPASVCIGMKSFQLYANTTSTLVGPQICTLQVSPSDSDNVWYSTTLTVTPSLVSGTVVSSVDVSNIVARRCRVSIAAAITSGTFDIYLNAMSV